MSDGLSPQTKRAVLARLAAGYKMRAVCAEFGISSTQVHEIQQWAKRLTKQEAETSDECEKAASQYIPTPEQIAEACAEISSGWSDAERKRRRPAEGCDELELPVLTTTTRRKGGYLT